MDVVLHTAAVYKLIDSVLSVMERGMNAVKLEVNYSEITVEQVNSFR